MRLCNECGEAILPERLAAQTATTLCINCPRESESGAGGADMVSIVLTTPDQKTAVACQAASPGDHHVGMT
jgi:hypothetical protein